MNESLRKIPFMERQQLAKRVERFANMLKSNRYFTVQTTGSTGIPISMWFDNEYMINYCARHYYFAYFNNINFAPISINLMDVTHVKEH